MTNALILFICYIIFSIALFLIFRSFVLWYWKLDKIEEHLRLILLKLNKGKDTFTEADKVFGEYFLVIQDKDLNINIFYATELLTKTVFNCIYEENKNIYIRNASVIIGRDFILNQLKREYKNAWKFNSIDDARNKYNELFHDQYNKKDI